MVREMIQQKQKFEKDMTPTNDISTFTRERDAS